MIKSNEFSVVAEVLRKKYYSKMVFSIYVLYHAIICKMTYMGHDYLARPVKLLSLFENLVAKYKLPKKVIRLKQKTPVVHLSRKWTVF